MCGGYVWVHSIFLFILYVIKIFHNAKLKFNNQISESFYLILKRINLLY